MAVRYSNLDLLEAALLCELDHRHGAALLALEPVLSLELGIDD